MEATPSVPNPAGANAKGTNVQVAVRCRPLNSEEKRTGQATVVTCDTADKRINVAYGPAGKKISKSFQFDKVFGMYSTQDEVFDQIVRPIVDETLAGFNCTIFAYGQTGTGKTHTMEGDINSEENAGIVPRSVKAILEQLEASGAEFTIRVSFLELYNEELQDLLNTSGDKKLKLCEDVKKGVVCQNLEEITVLTVNDIFDILHRGIQQRQTAETLCNKNSSRSHSIFTMKIMIKESSPDGEEVVRHGQLNLVDLAGSECIGRSGAKNDRAREAGSINQSLLTLGRVITALVDHHGHIPYRDSKLTRLLQESLGGKAKTCIIATLSPSQSAMEETLSTLDYAHRAKNIKNQPTVNQKLSKKVVLKEYFAEIETLRTQLQLTREKNGVYVDPGEFYAMEARLASQENQIAECEAALKSKDDGMKALRGENLQLSNDLDVVKSELDHVKDSLERITERFEETKAALQFTQTELAASDAVVREQVDTEDSLHRCGAELLSEAHNRRTDVDTLLGKVDRFVSVEKQRFKQTQETATSLHSIKLEIDEKTAYFKHENATQSTFLQNGITDMLQRSHSTCDTLKGALDTAVQALIGDSDRAGRSMSDSCDQLNSQLQTMNENVANILLKVRGDLCSWLDDVNSSMIETQKQLAQQQITLDVLSSGLNEHVSQYRSKTEDYLALQKANSIQSAKSSRELRDSLAAQLEQFCASQQQQSDNLAKLIASQAAAMEKSFKSLVQDLVTKSHTSITEQSQQIAFYCESARTSQDNAFTALTQMSSDQDACFQDSLNKLGEQVNAAGQTHDSLCSDVMQARLSAVQSLETISGSVLTQKQELDHTVSDVVQHVESAVSSGCVVIQETSSAAKTMVANVKTASQTMSDKATGSIGDFKAFLEDTGHKLSVDLTSHFQELDEHMETQQVSLNSLDEGLESFHQSMLATEVSVTGATPKKQRYAPLPDLAATRSHDKIKGEVRAAITSSQSACAINESGTSSDQDIPEYGAQSPFEDIENLSPGAANKVVAVDLKSSAGKELLSKSKAAKVPRSSKSSQDSDSASVSSVGVLRVRTSAIL